ncbi:protein NDUFAF4 homolog [Wyeomyia smithii]|uniref:protein NDUFAF4 homolog n=1 Tax=Wyeomyia smithii TaxID=174621 RepID=UPI002467DD08|nr:protein NDUFAF4 homolog [Wyeomyia smithii]
MGKVMSIVSRQVNRYNVESRAEKVMSQPKPKPAPTFQANQSDLDRILKEHPDLVKQLSQKNQALDDNLKSVFVTSTDPTVMPAESSGKNLPTDRTSADDFEFGHLEPTKVAKSRCTLRQAMKFIGNHQTSPSEWTAARIAAEYYMKESVVSNILTHFRAFEVHIPPKGLDKRKQILGSSNKSKLLE